MPTPGRRWRLILGTLAFAVWAPPALVGLPLAGLVITARPRMRTEWAAVLAAGVPSVGLLLGPAADLLSALVRAYVVLVTAAFVSIVLLAPAAPAAPAVPAHSPRPFLPVAVRATLVAGFAAVVLARAVLGSEAWRTLRWAATREASWSVRLLVELRPEIFVVFEPVVRFISDTVPAMLALQSLAGLALAWQWHLVVARRPHGAPLAPFREFRFGDDWVWAVVASLTVWVTPLLAGLKTAALNVAVVAGALYLLRGAAIVVAFAGAAGVSVGTLVIAAVAAAVLAVPLLFLIPGLATLGITDTWLQFRRRLTPTPPP